jgi:acetyl-CoA carboxylase biotin carboxylase subunit
MHRALLELAIEGIESSRDFHLRVMEDTDFRAGAIEIQWLERRLDSIIKVRPPEHTTKTAAVIAALIADQDRRSPKRGASATSSSTSQNSNAASTDGWTRAARLESLR